MVIVAGIAGWSIGAKPAEREAAVRWKYKVATTRSLAIEGNPALAKEAIFEHVARLDANGINGTLRLRCFQPEQRAEHVVEGVESAHDVP